MLGMLPQHRDAVAEACLKLGERAVPHLLRAFDGTDPSRCDFAEAVLADLGGSAADAVAETLARARQSSAKARLAGLLARIGSASHAGGLVALLDDESLDVRRAAMGALGSIGGSHAAKTLATRTMAPDRQQDRVAGLGALQRIGGREALEAILCALGAESWTVRLAAVEALAGLDTDQAADHLLAATCDPDRRVARSAVGAAEGAGLLDVAVLGAKALDQAAPSPERSQTVQVLCTMIGMEAKETLAHVWAHGDDETKDAIVGELAGEGVVAIGWLTPLIQSDQESRRAFAGAVAERLDYQALAVQRSVAALSRADVVARDLLWHHLIAHRTEAMATLEVVLRNTSDMGVRRSAIQLLDDLQGAGEQ